MGWRFALIVRQRYIHAEIPVMTEHPCSDALVPFILVNAVLRDYVPHFRARWQCAVVISLWRDRRPLCNLPLLRLLLFHAPFPCAVVSRFRRCLCSVFWSVFCDLPLVRLLLIARGPLELLDNLLEIAESLLQLRDASSLIVTDRLQLLNEGSTVVDHGVQGASAARALPFRLVAALKKTLIDTAAMKKTVVATDPLNTNAPLTPLVLIFFSGQPVQ